MHHSLSSSRNARMSSPLSLFTSSLGSSAVQMDTCPVSCIHWCTAPQLTLLEDAMARMERVRACTARVMQSFVLGLLCIPAGVFWHPCCWVGVLLGEVLFLLMRTYTGRTTASSAGLVLEQQLAAEACDGRPFFALQIDSWLVMTNRGKGANLNVFFEAKLAWEKRQSDLLARQQRAMWSWAGVGYRGAAGAAMQGSGRGPADKSTSSDSDEEPAGGRGRRRVSADEIAAAARRWRDYQRAKRQKAQKFLMG